jgi:hypothetical protein
MRTISFQTLLNAYAGAARVGRSMLQPEEEEQMCADLNAAALHLWEVETATMALPDLLTGKTVTLGTDGVIEAAEIEDASFWSVWKSDPRDVIWGYGRNELQIEATGQANGDVKVNGSAGDEVFVIYKTLVPQWTVERFVDGQQVPVGGLRWWETVVHPVHGVANGQVYQNVGAVDYNWSDLFNPTIWQPVTLPQSVQRIVVLKANFDRLWQGTNTPAVAEPAMLELNRALDAAFIGAQERLGAKRWLYNQNQ